MKYWIIALPRDKMEHCIDIGTFGLNRKYVLGSMQPGDFVACYVNKEYKIVALGEVTEPYYIDDSKVFPWASGSDLYIDRIKFKAEKINRSQEVDFIQLLDKMSFIKNLAYWNVHFNGSVKEISKQDWETIVAESTESRKG